MDIGQKIKILRTKAGLSTTNLANITGTSQSHITKIETGNSSLSISLLQRICSALGITLSEFFAENAETKVTPPGIRRLVESARRLVPHQLELVQRTVDELAEFNRLKETGMTGKEERDASKAGPPSHDSDIDLSNLKKLVEDDIIELTVKGRPLTPEQKEGFLRYIDAHPDFETEEEIDLRNMPVAAHNEGDPLVLTPGLEALLKVSIKLNEMLEKYLEEEKGTDL